MDAAGWGLIGTLVGAGASIATTFLSNRHSAALHASSSREERLERGRAFQRQTLLELQDAFHDAIRLIALTQLEDIRAFHSSGSWARQRLPDDLAENLRTANRRVMLLVERVADDSVRTSVKGVMNRANSVAYAASKEESIAVFDTATFESVTAIELIGEKLRGLY